MLVTPKGSRVKDVTLPPVRFNMRTCRPPVWSPSK